jgi:hypothetical protein
MRRLFHILFALVQSLLFNKKYYQIKCRAKSNKIIRDILIALRNIRS